MAEAVDGFNNAPIPFITVDGDSNFRVNETAIRFLESIENPVAVVAVAGLYRTGKSFLLNQLLKKSGGFQVGPTVNACTRGILSCFTLEL